MPRDKDLKRLVRARMTKTGESYTAARAQITRKAKSVPREGLRVPAQAATTFAELAGMSDEAVKEKTGCDWTKWVYVLDRRGAAAMSHREIAEIVKTKYKVQDWWAQMVTVGYERIKGLRRRGQGRDGAYEATKSRTFNVPVDVLFDAWANAKTRRRWLDGKTVKVRTATAPKSMRLDWPDGGIIAVGFVSKGREKSSVAISHAKLPDRDAANQLKQYWADRLDALGGILGSTPRTRIATLGRGGIE
jgi:hypothetical protein